jgi:hypothetical protein
MGGNISKIPMDLDSVGQKQFCKVKIPSKNMINYWADWLGMFTWPRLLALLPKNRRHQSKIVKEDDVSPQICYFFQI